MSPYSTCEVAASLVVQVTVAELVVMLVAVRRRDRRRRGVEDDRIGNGGRPVAGRILELDIDGFGAGAARQRPGLGRRVVLRGREGVPLLEKRICVTAANASLPKASAYRWCCWSRRPRH